MTMFECLHMPSLGGRPSGSTPSHQASAEALTSRIRQIPPLPVNHAGTRVEDKDATIACTGPSWASI
jgi:hypothetical protein